MSSLGLCVSLVAVAQLQVVQKFLLMSKASREQNMAAKETSSFPDAS